MTNRFSRTIAAAVVFAAGLAIAAPAVAAGHGTQATKTGTVHAVQYRSQVRHERRRVERNRRYGRIHRRDVVRILAWNGYHRIHRVRRLGPRFRANAVTSYGRAVVVTVSARNGRILKTRYIPRRRHWRR